MKTEAEKRKSERYDCHVPVEGKKGTAFADSQTVDISQGGVGFISHQAVPVNTMMAVEIALTPEDDPIVVQGRVKWVRQVESDCYRIGMTFADAAAGFKSHLNKAFA